MSLFQGLTPVVAGLLVCVVAYVSVRRAHRRIVEAKREVEAAAE